MAASGYVEKKGTAGERDIINERMNGLQNVVYDHDFDSDENSTVCNEKDSEDISKCFNRWKYAAANSQVVVGSADFVDLLQGASPLTLCVSKEPKQKSTVYRQNNNRTLRIERSGSTESVAATSGGESCQSSSIASDSASEPSSPSRPVTPLPMPPVPAHLADHCPYECLRADSEDSGLGPSPAKSSMGPASPLEGYVSPIQFVPEADDDDDDDEMNVVDSLLDLTTHRPNGGYINCKDTGFLPYAVANIVLGADGFDAKALKDICQRSNSNFRFCLPGGDSPNTNSDRSVDSVQCDRSSSSDIPRDCGAPGEAGDVLDFQFLMNSKNSDDDDVEKCPLSDTSSESSVECSSTSSSCSVPEVDGSVSKPSPPPSPSDITACEQTVAATAANTIITATTTVTTTVTTTSEDTSALCRTDSELQCVLSSQTRSSSEKSAAAATELFRLPSSPPCDDDCSLTKVDDAEFNADSTAKVRSPSPRFGRAGGGVVDDQDDDEGNDSTDVVVSHQKPDKLEEEFSAEDTDYKPDVVVALQDPSCVVSESDYCVSRSPKPDLADDFDESRQSSSCGSSSGGGAIEAIVHEEEEDDDRRSELCHEFTSDCTSSSCSQVANDAQSVAADDSNTCKWLNCEQTADANANSSDLVDHLRKCHVQSQFDKNETYVCLWVGCKVFERASSSRSWLERHVLLHGGNKPFRCIVDGCRQRFGTEGALQRHVNSHFPQSNRNGKNGHSGDHAGSGPNGRLLKRKRNHRYRRRPHSVKSNDFFDDSIMEQIRHSLLELSSVEGMDRSGPPAAITFHSTVVARRTEGSGKAKVLLHWDPEDLLPDCWVAEEEASCNFKKTIPISSLPPEALVQLDPVYKAKLLPRPGKRRRK